MRVKTLRLSAFLVLAAVLGGCADTSNAWNLREAARVYDASPRPQSLPAPDAPAATGDVPQDIQPIEARAPLFPDAPSTAQPTNTEVAPAYPVEKPLQARVDLGASCEALPPIPGQTVLLVLAIRDVSPEASAMFAARAAHQRLAACYGDQGVEVRRETRLGQSQLDQPAEILIY